MRNLKTSSVLALPTAFAGVDPTYDSTTLAALSGSSSPKQRW
jgi:hypothetical protein